MTKLTQRELDLVNDCIASDTVGLLRDGETLLGYFVKRMILKLKGYGNR